MVLHGRIRTDDFQKFYGSGLDRIQLLRIRIGLNNFSVRSSLIGTSGYHGSGIDSGRIPRFLDPVSSKMSDFTPCVHAQNNIPLIKYAEKTDDYGV